MSPGRNRRERASVDPWILLALVVAAFAPFAGTLLYGYVYDDSAIILHNRVLEGWTSLTAVWKNPYWANGGPESAGLYRPLLMAFFAIIWNGAHKFAIAFHFFAVALHVAATLLVATLLRRGVGRWPAAGAALWFAVHPIHVEAVANISNVSEVLVAVWTILLTLVLLPPRDAASLAATAPGWGRSALAATLYAAALLTKESGAVAPVLAVLAAIAWRQPTRETSIRSALAGAREWWRVVALWAVVLVGVLLLRRIVLGGMTGPSSIAAPGLEGIGTVQRAWSMLALGGRVAGLLLWPTVQNPHYGPSILPTPPGVTLDAVIALASIVGTSVACGWLALRTSRPDSRPLVAVGWCLIGFLPASNLLAATGQILGERTLYVSSIGVAMLVAWGLDLVFERASVSRPSGVDAARLAPIAAGALLLAWSGRASVRTHDYAGVWREQPTLFAAMVRADSLSYRGYQLLAIEAKNHRRYAESAPLYARAYALRPSDPTLLTDYGEYLLEMNRNRYALAIGQRLFTHSEIWTDARAVTLLLNATGRVWGVDSVLAAAQRVNARAPSARTALFIGMANELRGDSSAAHAAYVAGLRLAPGDSTLATRAAAWPRSQ